MLTISKYFLLFYIYSIVGYFCEVISIYHHYKRVEWHRGYLLGPYLPIFGFGALIITIFLEPYKTQPITTFVLGMVYCGTLEYITSYLLERIFHLHWWDYSKRKLNINGRVCLETSVMFGLGALVLVNFTNEWLFNIFQRIPNRVIITLSIVIFLIVCFDIILSTIETFRLKKDIKLMEMDDATSEIKKRIRESLEKNYYYYKRLLEAFPNVKKHNLIIQQISEQMNQMKKGRKNEK